MKQLKLAWTFSTGTLRGLEAAPLVVDNTLYLVTPWPNILYALDLTKPGAPLKWAYEPKPVAAAKGVACCDWVNRGAVYGFGKIYYNTLDNYTVSVDATSGILARSATIENRESQPVTIEQAAAAAWALPAAHSSGSPATGLGRWGGYTLNYLTGRWAGEWTLNQEPVRHGARVLESRRGSTGHQANPWFAIQAGDPDENHGEVWFGALAWSGSWRIAVEQDQLDAVRVTGGFNPFDFGYVLHPGQSLETPVFYGGYSNHGLGGASRKGKCVGSWFCRFPPQAAHPREPRRPVPARSHLR